jgi:hypothetical protein
VTPRNEQKQVGKERLARAPGSDAVAMHLERCALSI